MIKGFERIGLVGEFAPARQGLIQVEQPVDEVPIARVDPDERPIAQDKSTFSSRKV